MDLPQYTIKPNVNRVILFKIIQLVSLALLFYLALWLNMQLGFNLKLPLAVNILIIVVLILAIIIEMIKFHVIYSQFAFLFYTNKVLFQKKNKVETLFFKDIAKPKLKINALDKFMGTGTITLTKKLSIGPINKPQKIFDYLLKLIDYHKRTQQTASSVQNEHRAFSSQTQIN